jgi:hypothetical protein
VIGNGDTPAGSDLAQAYADTLVRMNENPTSYGALMRYVRRAAGIEVYALRSGVPLSEWEPAVQEAITERLHEMELL